MTRHNQLNGHCMGLDSCSPCRSVPELLSPGLEEVDGREGFGGEARPRDRVRIVPGKVLLDSSSFIYLACLIENRLVVHLQAHSFKYTKPLARLL